MPWIENVSAYDVSVGQHTDMGENSMLIQIIDPDTPFPAPKCTFREVHQFKFWDADKPEPILGFDESELISDSQAKQIADLLQKALDKNMNVLVHCWAGICRSGAVVEVGTIIGFTDTKRNIRIPNLRVKGKLMHQFNLGYYSE